MFVEVWLGDDVTCWLIEFNGELTLIYIETLECITIKMVSGSINGSFAGNGSYI